LQEPPPRPDIELVLVYPSDEVAIGIFNSSATELVREAKYCVGIWNLDAPESERLNPLPIPVAVGDYIRPKEWWGPNQFIGIPAVLRRIKDGDRLFGFVTIRCPTCVVTKRYWIYVKYKHGGWYAQETREINLNWLAKAIPILSADKEDAEIAKLVPENKRTLIK
jgi:hypothetical protein